jgi:hypothetical protein
MNLKKYKFKETTIPSRAYDFMFFGFAILVLGIVCNFLAVTENKGLMPVVSDFNFRSSEHFRVYDVNEVSNIQLADIYNIKGNIFSIGDFLMIIGGIFIALSIYIRIHNGVINYLINRKK